MRHRIIGKAESRRIRFVCMGPAYGIGYSILRRILFSFHRVRRGYGLEQDERDLISKRVGLIKLSAPGRNPFCCRRTSTCPRFSAE